MDINDLIEKLSTEFEMNVQEKLTPATSFRGMKEWSSMHALIIIALVDAEYEVTITGNDLVQMNTVQDLYDLIMSRKK
ncbi:MAG: acyl carrier protein [Bacteroidetes bacterium]|nr:acyl carrier protein [Bacteroidota bacterium]